MAGDTPKKDTSSRPATAALRRFTRTFLSMPRLAPLRLIQAVCRSAGRTNVNTFEPFRATRADERPPIGHNQGPPMTVAQLASTNLHDPVLPLVRPVAVVLRCSQTIADAHAAIRAAPKSRRAPYFYVLDDEDQIGR